MAATLITVPLTFDDHTFGFDRDRRAHRGDARDGQVALVDSTELERAPPVLLSSVIGTWTRQLETDTCTWSDALGALIGCEPATLPEFRDALLAALSDGDRARLRDALSRCERDGTLVDELVNVRLADGTIGRWRMYTELHRSPLGEPLAVVGTVHDVAELQKRTLLAAEHEEHNYQAQKLESLGVLAGGIAHDFNNLLVGVLSNASLALVDIDHSSPAYGVVLEIERTAQRAAELTRQLLAYSGKGRLLVEPLNISALAGDMAQLLRSVIDHNASLHLELDDALPVVRGDATQLRQVIMNLLTNASDALQGSAGTITVRTSQAVHSAASVASLQFGDLVEGEPCVQLEVHDTGCGMSSETAERIFDPFYTTKPTGRGLGLAAAIGIVRGHRAHIAVHSALGGGTRFALSFPVANVEAAAPTVPDAPVIPLANGKVMIVDDDPVVRSVCAALLSRRGFEVESVGSGLDALDQLTSDPTAWKFVLLDLTMPGCSGAEVLLRLRNAEASAERPPIPVFLMSGYTEHDVEAGVGALQHSGFLQKPFTFASLDALIATLRPA